MAWNNAVITSKGLEMLRKSIDDGELTVVSASGSDEIYPDASLMVQTAPANEKQSFAITEIKNMDNGKRIRVTITNEGLKTGYVMKQLCVWAKLSENESPQIIAILQDEDGTPIPSEDEMASFLMQFYVLLKVDRTANMQIVMENPSYVTYDAIKGMLEDKADLVNGKVSAEQLPERLSVSHLADIDTALEKMEQNIEKHTTESMPHKFVDNKVTYRWGFRTLNGNPQIIYEEVAE